MRVKRLWLAALSVLAIFVLATSVAETATAIQLIINGMEVHSDVPPVIVNGRLMVPIRTVSEAMGLVVAWDSVASIVRVDQAEDPWKFDTPKCFATQVMSVFAVPDCGHTPDSKPIVPNDLHFEFAQETWVTAAGSFANVEGNGSKSITLSNPSSNPSGQPRSLLGQSVMVRFGVTAGALLYTSWWWTKDNVQVPAGPVGLHTAVPAAGAPITNPPK